MLRIFALAAVVGILRLVRPTTGKKTFYLISFLYFLLNISLVFFLSLYPMDDQYYMTWIASDMLKGEYSQFEPYGYMDLYPFQYSFMNYVKLVFAVMGADNYYALQVLNVVYLWLIIWLIVKMTRFMYGQEQYGIGIALMLFAPLSLYVTYIYGNFLSLALSLGSAFFLMKFLHREGHQPLNFGLVVLLNTISILAKNNALIFMIAEVCILILFSVKRADKRNILANVLLAGALITAYLLAMTAVNRDLSRYTEQDKVGTPKISWIAMGLQTGGYADGWNNFYNRDVYWNNDRDVELAARQSRESIRESVGRFLADPGYCAKFFYHKICSEWMNPSFEALNLIQHSTVKNPNTTFGYSVLARAFLHKEQGESLDATHFFLNEYLRIYEFAMIVGALFYLIKRRLVAENCFFAIVFIGGFLFHIFWEASSQYMLPYFVMIIPYGVMGIKDMAASVKGNFFRRTAILPGI